MLMLVIFACSHSNAHCTWQTQLYILERVVVSSWLWVICESGGVYRTCILHERVHTHDDSFRVGLRIRNHIEIHEFLQLKNCRLYANTHIDTQSVRRHYQKQIYLVIISRTSNRVIRIRKNKHDRHQRHTRERIHRVQIYVQPHTHLMRVTYLHVVHHRREKSR